MGLYSSVQSNLGQTMAGVEIPFIPMELGIPAIPGYEVDFKNNTLAALGIGALVVGSLSTLRVSKRALEALHSHKYPAGSDMQRTARNSVRESAVRGFAAGLFTTAMVGGFMLDTAEPTTDESINMVDRVGVVIDAGYKARADDVETQGGMTNRISAATYAFLLEDYGFSALKDIDVTYIAAGETPKNIGTTRNGTVEERIAIEQGMQEYFQPDQWGTEASGGGDIATGIAMVADDYDKVIVVTGSMEGHYRADLLAGQAEPGVRDVSVIALGQPGSKVEMRSGSAPAEINKAYNDNVVGSEDSYIAASTTELGSIIQEIIDSEIVESVESDYEGYAKLARFGLLGAGGLVIYEFIRRSGFAPIRTIKKVLGK